MLCVQFLFLLGILLSKRENQFADVKVCVSLCVCELQWKRGFLGHLQPSFPLYLWLWTCTLGVHTTINKLKKQKKKTYMLLSCCSFACSLQRSCCRER